MKNLAVSKGSAMMKALGNSKRLEILYHLADKEMNVGELEKKVGFIILSVVKQPLSFWLCWINYITNPISEGK